MVKKRQPVEVGQAVIPAIPSASTLWPKLPAIREFVHATAYEDGSPRTPGYITIRNRATTMEVTCYDVDSGTRLSARGQTLDQALSLMEQLLGVEEAPWERDNYLADQLAKRAKKRR